VKEYLTTLDDASFGAASKVTPKFVSPSDPAAQWTGAMRGPAFFAYADNYLIDVKFGTIMDVEATRAIRQAEVGAAKTMIERTEERFAIKPERLAAAYGSAAHLNWLVLVYEKQIAPHIPVIDKSKRDDGTFSREDFSLDLRATQGQLHLLPEFAAEMVNLGVNLIAAIGAATVRAVRQATSTIPIVFAVVVEPIGDGLATDLERPGGNVTGITTFDPRQATAQLEFLRAVSLIPAENAR
jgi:ABC transporter substrate binding protein